MRGSLMGASDEPQRKLAAVSSGNFSLQRSQAFIGPPANAISRAVTIGEGIATNSLANTRAYTTQHSFTIVQARASHAAPTFLLEPSTSRARQGATTTCSVSFS